VFWTRKENGNYAVAMAAQNPKARSEDLIVQEVDDETLVYDVANARAHCLSADAAAVWHAADGEKSEAVLAEELGLDSEIVTRALGELEEKELIEARPVVHMNGNGHSSGVTRREFGLKSAKVGGAVAAGPMIYSIVAPTALATVSTPEFLCNFYSGKSCDACAQICGCCCCCQGCSKTTGSPACKMCSSISTCPRHTEGCSDQLEALGGSPGRECTSGPKCSDTAKPGKCLPPCTTDSNGNPIPQIDCHTHDCNCFGIPGNPCLVV
jgi:hypothetical protein